MGWEKASWCSARTFRSFMQGGDRKLGAAKHETCDPETIFKSEQVWTTASPCRRISCVKLALARLRYIKCIMLSFVTAGSLGFKVPYALSASASSRTSTASMIVPIASEFTKSRAPLGGSMGNKIQGSYKGRVVSTAPLKAAAAGASTVAAPAPVTKAEVMACQDKWAKAIASISKVYLEEGDFVAAAGEAAGELYGYGHHNVLFKPTKATKHPFRPTPEVAMSYFVGADAMDMAEFKGEDAGFAINGGKGWKKVVFTNHQVDLHGDVAIAMGSYDFTCATTGDVATVEYTFGYKRCEDGKVRICLHHSSVPYNP